MNVYRLNDVIGWGDHEPSLIESINKLCVGTVNKVDVSEYTHLEIEKIFNEAGYTSSSIVLPSSREFQLTYTKDDKMITYFGNWFTNEAQLINK